MSQIDPEAPAFPSPEEVNEFGVVVAPAPKGLTIRAHFAAMAMQGFCQGAYTDNWNEVECAEHAVLMADALISALNQRGEATSP